MLFIHGVMYFSFIAFIIIYHYNFYEVICSMDVSLSRLPSMKLWIYLSCLPLYFHFLAQGLQHGKFVMIFKLINKSQSKLEDICEALTKEVCLGY